jgi:hypothetical protein
MATGTEKEILITSPPPSNASLICLIRYTFLAQVCFQLVSVVFEVMVENECGTG